MHDQSLVPRSGGLAGQPNLSGADSDRQLIAQWLLRHQSPHTRSAYAGDVRAFLAFAGDPRLAAVTVRHLQAWVSHLDATLAPGTVNRKLASLRSLLGYAQQTGYLPFNVGAAVRPRRVPDRLAERILPERDCLNLLAADSAYRAPPKTLDLRLLLREGGRNLMEMPEADLRMRACDHGWEFACEETRQ